MVGFSFFVIWPQQEELLSANSASLDYSSSTSLDQQFDVLKKGALLIIQKCILSCILNSYSSTRGFLLVFEGNSVFVAVLFMIDMIYR